MSSSKSVVGSCGFTFPASVAGLLAGNNLECLALTAGFAVAVAVVVERIAAVVVRSPGFVVAVG